MRIVTFAWGKRYRAFAERLCLSAKLLGLEVEVLSRPGEAPSREAAWAARPALLASALMDEDRPILYLDSDCVIRRRPDLGDVVPPGSDFAAAEFERGKWRLGVLWIAPSNTALSVLRSLDALQSLEPRNDEDLFPGLVRSLGAKVATLPNEYAWCVGWGDRERFGNRLPVIEANV